MCVKSREDFSTYPRLKKLKLFEKVVRSIEFFMCCDFTEQQKPCKKACDMADSFLDACIGCENNLTSKCREPIKVVIFSNPDNFCDCNMLLDIVESSSGWIKGKPNVMFACDFYDSAKKREYAKSLNNDG